MGIFSTRTRHTCVGPGAGVELTEELRVALPPRFEAVGEALASGAGAVEACAGVGRELALDGVSLGEALDGLRATHRLVRGGDPGYPHTQAVAVAWSESTLGYLHQLSCEDPLTGLATQAHVRSRLAELYRGQLREDGGPRDTHALVVVDLAAERPRAGGRADVLTHALRVARLGETARSVFAGTEPVGRVGPGRVVVVARRDPRIGRRVALLRRMLTETAGEGRPPRVWIEGLPGTDRAAGHLLDELARG